MKFRKVLYWLFILSALGQISPSSFAKAPSKMMAKSVPKEFIHHLLEHHYISGSPVQLWSGQLPPQLPIQIPLGKETQVVASILDGQSTYTVFLESAYSEAVQNVFYRDRLRKAGWSQLKFSPSGQVIGEEPALTQPSASNAVKSKLVLYLDDASRSGSFHLTQMMNFCHRPDDAELELRAMPRWGKMTPIRIQITPKNGILCRRNSSIDFLEPTFTVSLAAPRGSKTLSGGGSRGEDRGEWSETLKSPLTDDALLPHYEAQLRQLGWSAIAQSKDKPLLWSIWTFQDRKQQRWQGILSVAPLGLLPDLHLVRFQVINTTQAAKSPYPPITPVTSNLKESVPYAQAAKLIRYLYESQETPQFLVGQLPPELPPQFALPTNTRVIGSLIRHPSQDVQILLESPLPWQQIQRFYRKRFESEGWRDQIWEHLQQIGFGFESKSLMQISFLCKPGNKLRPYISSLPLTNGLTNVSVSLTHAETADCSPKYVGGVGQDAATLKKQMEKMEQRSRDTFSPLPRLSPPLDSEVVSGGASGQGNQSLQSSALISTSEPFESLTAHYTAQMKKAGWTQRVDSSKPMGELSLWFKKDRKRQTWQAVFMLIPIQGASQQYAAYLNLDRTDPPPREYE
jgi:hypothetical protein